MQDRYQVVRDGVVLQEELHERSPATRGYSQAQARQLYAGVGFIQLQVLSDFSWTPALDQDDTTLFCVLGMHP